MTERSPSGPMRGVFACLAVIAVALGLALAGWTLLLWLRWHPHLPWRDMFVILDDLQPLLQGDNSWRDWLFLFEAHYSAHRITIPRLLVLWDIIAFGGRSHLLYGFGWASLLVVFLVYTRMARDYFQGSTALWWFCCGSLAALLFAPAHLWNLLNAINTSWHISFALAVLAFWVLLRRSGPPSLWEWLLAYGLATLAAFTTFTGVILWLLLPALALSRGWRNCRWQTLVISGACSLLLTLLYLDGITSDAEIAAGWDAGDPAIAAQIQQAGKAALDGNSLARVISKTAQVLTWPMGSEWPLLAGIVFTLSVPLLALAWVRLLWPGPTGDSQLHAWLKLCLLLATLALGVALAIQLGRLIDQPNHAHGPSYERYNTIVAIYWAGIFGLLLGLFARDFSARSAVVMATSLVALGVLLVPRGNYLQQEISSMADAARLYAAGETPALREPLDRKLLRFKPEYVYHFDPLFQDRQLAYAYPADTPGERENLRPCSPSRVELSLEPSNKPGFQAIRGRIHGLPNVLVRDMVLVAGARPVARLYAVHEGGYSPLDLMLPAANSWVGQADGRVDLSGALQLIINNFDGIPLYCALAVFAPGTESSARQRATEVPPNV
jgi:hypothetical protein